MSDLGSVLAQLGHPVRLAILERLARPRDGDQTVTRRGKAVAIASPKDVADDLNVDLGVVSYHFKRLSDSGLLRLVRKVPRRGAVAHYYAAAGLFEGGRLRAVDQQWLALPDSIRQSFALAALREVARRASLASSQTDDEDPLTSGWDDVLEEWTTLCGDFCAERRRGRATRSEPT